MSKITSTAFAVFALAASAGSALAQGVPANAVSYVGTGSATFATISGSIDLPAIPAGKRLIVTAATCRGVAQDASANAEVRFGAADLNLIGNDPYSITVLPGNGRVTQLIGTVRAIAVEFPAGGILRAPIGGPAIKPQIFVSLLDNLKNTAKISCAVFGYLQADK